MRGFIDICTYVECNSQCLCITCFIILGSLQNSLRFFVISNFRGSVLAPLNNAHYASVSELQKVFEICEDSSKIPFGYGRRCVEFHWMESVIFYWSV